MTSKLFREMEDCLAFAIKHGEESGTGMVHISKARAKTLLHDLRASRLASTKKTTREPAWLDRPE
jgi:hypothetical protein